MLADYMRLHLRKRYNTRMHIVMSRNTVIYYINNRKTFLRCIDRIADNKVNG